MTAEITNFLMRPANVSTVGVGSAQEITTDKGNRFLIIGTMEGFAVRKLGENCAGIADTRVDSGKTVVFKGDNILSTIQVRAKPAKWW